MSENNNTNNFNWKKVQTFPTKILKGVQVSVSIMESPAGSKQLAISKVSTDSSGFPRGASKNFWFPYEQSEDLANYILSCIKNKK